MTGGPPLLAVQDLAVWPQAAAQPELDHFSSALAEGETTLVIGEPGCGKEALMRVLAGAMDRGERVSGGLAWRGSTRLAAGGAAVPHSAYWPSAFSRPLNAWASTRSQLARVIARKAHIPFKSALAEFALGLERLPAAPSLSCFEAPPNALSPEVLLWGLLAAAMALAPELLLADRSLSSLAPTETRALVKALRGEQQRLGFALLYTDMNTDIAAQLGGRLVVLRRGRIVEEGPVARLATQRAHAYTRTLLGPLLQPPSLKPGAAAPARGHPVIQAIQLDARPDDRAGLTFELRQGAAIALLGAHGSGRHALVRTLLGLRKARSGRVLFDAVDVAILSGAMRRRLRRRVAMVSGAQEILDPRLTVHDTIMEPLRGLLTLPRHLAESCRDSALKRVGLSSVAGTRLVASLTVPEKRRLQIARAIASAPLLVILDEPLRGLDGFAQSVTQDLLKTFRSEEGPAFLLITEDVRVAAAFAEEAIVFKDGRAVERGRLADLITQPKEGCTRALVEACGLESELPAACAAS